MHKHLATPDNVESAEEGDLPQLHVKEVRTMFEEPSQPGVIGAQPYIPHGQWSDMGIVTGASAFVGSVHSILDGLDPWIVSMYGGNMVYDVNHSLNKSATTLYLASHTFL